MEILETTIGYTCPIFRVDERLVKYSETFTEKNYVIVRHPGVQIISLNKNGQIVLIKQFRGRENIEKIDIVGGKLDKFDSTIDEAMEQSRRELFEETGFKAKNLELLQVYDIVTNWFERKYFQFIAWDLEQFPLNLKGGEEITLFEIHPEELVHLINSNIFEPYEEDALIKSLQLFKQKNLI